MTLVDLTPGQLDLRLYAGQDTTLRLFFSTDAPAHSEFVGPYSAADGYDLPQIVEYSSAFYLALGPSTNITPGTNAQRWRQLTPDNLTGFTGWKAQLSARDTADSFTIDASGQAGSVISVSISGGVLERRKNKTFQEWSLNAQDANGANIGFFVGAVTVERNPTALTGAGSPGHTATIVATVNPVTVVVAATGIGSSGGSGGGGAVASVNGETGIVTLGYADVGADAAGAAQALADTLGTASTHAASDFDAAGAAAAEATARATAVSGEATARATADTTLTTAVAAEATTARAAESTNATAIAAEVTNRGTAVTAEASTRSTADTTNATAITAETSRATTAEALKAPLASPALTGAPTAPDPTTAQGLSTKAYTDAAAQGLKVKTACAVSTTANVTLSGEQTIDGITTSASRILVKNQTTTADNGIYVTGSGAWARAADMDADSEVAGAYALVTAGTANGGIGWTVQGSGPFTLGTTAIVWAQFSGAATITSGTGITVTGNSVAIDPTVTATVTNLASEATTARAAESTNATAISTETTRATAAEALKAPLASPTFTGTVTIPTGASITAPTGLVKADVGLGNVDNTSDATKNSATATLTNKTLTAPVLSSPTGLVAADIPTLAESKITNLTTDLATLTTAVGGALTIGRNAFNANTGPTIVSADRQLVNTTTLTAARSVTLPAASSRAAGTRMQLIDESGSPSLTNTLTWTAAGSDVLHNPLARTQTTSLIMRSGYGMFEIISNGSNGWYVVPSNQHPYLWWQHLNPLAINDGVWTPQPFNLLQVDFFNANVGPQAHTTTVASGSNGAVLPQATINVASTAGFPTAGWAVITGPPGASVDTIFGYTGVTGTSFTGCNSTSALIPTAGISTGTLATGQTVTGANVQLDPGTPYLWYAMAETAWVANDTGYRNIRFRDLTSGLGFPPVAQVDYPAMNKTGQNVQVQLQPGVPIGQPFIVENYQSSGAVLNTYTDGFQAAQVEMIHIGAA